MGGWVDLGKKIKVLRKERGLTLAELSQRTGIAQSTLSRVERGQRTGTVKTHLKLCEALGVTISELYTSLEEKPREEISPIETTTRDIEGFRYDEKAFAISLTKDLFRKKMKPELLVIAPAHTAKEPGDPSGTEKFVFCHEGSLEVIIEKAHYKLKKGNSLYFNSSLPHLFKNIGKKPAKCVVVLSLLKS